MIGPDQADFLAAGEHHLHGTVGEVVLKYGLQGFHDGSHTSLAVAAEDGGAVGGYPVAVDLGLDSPARLDGVQVGGEEEGVVAILAGDDVAEGVTLDGQAELFQPGDEVLGNFLLFLGWAVDSYQVAKGPDQPVLVNHGVYLGLCRLGGKRWRRCKLGRIPLEPL